MESLVLKVIRISNNSKYQGLKKHSYNYNSLVDAKGNKYFIKTSDKELIFNAYYKVNFSSIDAKFNTKYNSIIINNVTIIQLLNINNRLVSIVQLVKHVCKLTDKQLTNINSMFNASKLNRLERQVIDLYNNKNLTTNRIIKLYNSIKWVNEERLLQASENYF